MTPSPTGQKLRKSVHTLLSPPERRDASKWATGRCKRCGRYFRRTRTGQEFCVGGLCRLAWWKKHRADWPHACPRCQQRCRRRSREAALLGREA